MKPLLSLASAALLGAVASPDASAQTNVSLRFEGSVLSIAGPLQAPFDTSAMGEPVTVVYDVVAPGAQTGNLLEYEVVPSSVSVTIGAAVDTFAPGSAAVVELRADPGLTSLRGRVPLAGGLVIEPLLFDIDPITIFPTNDLTQLFGTYDSSELDLAFLNLVETFAGIQVDLATLTIGPGVGAGVGDAYCGPAVPGSAGISAELAGVGSASVASNDFGLRASSLPPGAFGLFLVSRDQAFVQNPGGSLGNLCLGGAIGRYTGPGQIQSSSSSGVITLGIDWNAVPEPSGLAQAVAGDAWNFQCWYRDLVNGMPVSNYTNGYAVTLR